MSSYGSSSRSAGFVGGIFALAAVIGIGWLFWWVWGPTVAHTFGASWRGGWLFLLGVVLVIGLALVATFIYEQSPGLAVVAIIAALGITAVVITGWVRINYDTGHKYAEDIKKSSEIVSYDQRVPYEVAQASASQNMKNVTGELQESKHLADAGEHGTWDALVIRRGWAQGYEAVQTLNAPLFGSVNDKDASFCKFNRDAQLRIGGGLPHNNLSKAALSKVPLNVNFDRSDVYAYCDGDTPLVVVPMKQVSGWYAPTWKAWGIVVYNGKTGALNAYNKVSDVEKFEGPTYPISLAAQQRDGLDSTGSFSDHWFKRVGYNASSDNPDAQLRVYDSTDSAYVTALNPKGSSQSIVGTVSVDSKFTGSGKRNPLELDTLGNSHTLPSINSQQQTIGNTYSNLNGFAVSPDKGGYEFYEIVPGKNGAWTASIGRNLSILYRATVEVKDGSTVVTLYDANGDKVDGLGNGSTDQSEGNTNDSDNGGTVTVPLPEGAKSLSDLSDAQLQELGQNVIKELGKRANQTPEATASATPAGK